MKSLLTVIAIGLAASAATVFGAGCTASSTEYATADSLRRADSAAAARAAADSIALIQLQTARIDSLNRFTTSADLALFSAHGLVRNLIYERSCEWTGSPRAGVLEFDTLGCLTSPTAGRGSGNHITALDGKSYGWNGNRVTFVGTAEFGADEAEYKRLNRTYLKHIYNADGKLTESQVLNNMDEIRITYTYAVTDTDRYGNWLVREITRREIETGTGKELHREIIPEIRSIVYYNGDTIAGRP